VLEFPLTLRVIEHPPDENILEQAVQAQLMGGGFKDSPPAVYSAGPQGQPYRKFQWRMYALKEYLGQSLSGARLQQILFPLRLKTHVFCVVSGAPAVRCEVVRVGWTGWRRIKL